MSSLLVVFPQGQAAALPSVAGSWLGVTGELELTTALSRALYLAERLALLEVRYSAASISLQRATHSSQISVCEPVWLGVPAISLRTSCLVFPQKEQARGFEFWGPRAAPQVGHFADITSCLLVCG
jgi:hypothetical protein